MNMPTLRLMASLPDTTTKPGLPASKDALEYVAVTFVGPILEIFNAGTVITKEQMMARISIYAIAVMGFEPTTYDQARNQMVLERTSPFPPTPGECREILQRVDLLQDKYAIPAMRQRMRSMFLSTAFSGAARWWNQWGPAPGEDGCRLSQADQDAVWRELLEMARKGGDGSGWETLRAFNSRSPVRISPESDRCPIPKAIMREFGIPITKSELDALRDKENEKRDRARQAADNRMREEASARGARRSEGEARRTKLSADGPARYEAFLSRVKESAGSV